MARILCFTTAYKTTSGHNNHRWPSWPCRVPSLIIGMALGVGSPEGRLASRWPSPGENQPLPAGDPPSLVKAAWGGTSGRDEPFDERQRLHRASRIHQMINKVN